MDTSFPAVIAPAQLPGPPASFETDLLAAFLASLKPRTLNAYLFDLGDFSAFLHDQPLDLRGLACPPGTDAAIAVESLLRLSGGRANALVLNYRTHLVNRGLAPATIARRLAALRSVTTLGRKLGRIAWTLEIKSPRIEARRDVRGPDRDGWRKLWKAAKAQGDGPMARRDRAIISLLYDLGLRRGEVAALELADVDRHEQNVAVVGKGWTEKQRLTLPRPTLNALKEWIMSRGDRTGPLFHRLRYCSVLNPLNGGSIALIVARLGKLAGLPRPVRPHGLRHAAITAALDLGCDIRQVRKFSRHAKIETVIRYDDSREDEAGAIARKLAGDRR